MKYEWKIIKIILGLVLVCTLIYPALGLELGVSVLPADLQIVSTDPSEIFEMYVDEAQTLTVTLDRDVTAVWYENNIEIRTDHNVTTSSYYFTSSTEGVFIVTVSSTDSLTNTSQVNFSWFIYVVPGSVPYPTPVPAIIPVEPYKPPVEVIEDEIDEEEIEEPKGWKIPEELYIPGILITYLSLWDESTRPQFINTAIEVLDATEWKFPDYQKPEFHVPKYDFPELPELYLPEFHIPKYDFPELYLPELQISELKLPEELNVLKEVDKITLGLVVVFLTLFIITLKGGPGGRSIFPGRDAPIKR